MATQYRNITYTVQKGDTLWAIAKKFLGDPTQYPKIASWNNISNPNLIHPGQVLIVGTEAYDDGTSGSGATSPSAGQTTVQPATNPPNYGTVSINQFGLQTDTDRTVFVTWSWNQSNTDHYKVIWYYRTENGIDFIGNESTTNNQESIYNAPSNALSVKVKIQPVSTTYKVNDSDTYYWTANWSSVREYTFELAKPTTPSSPSIKIENFKLTAELTNINTDTSLIEFQVVRDDLSVFGTASVSVVTRMASHTWNINAGSKYKVRARAMSAKYYGVYSEWSDYSENVGTPPGAAPTKVSCAANSKTEIKVTWGKVDNADSYDIEYTTDKTYFDVSDATTIVSGIKGTTHILTGLGSGDIYYIRVRAVNEQGESGWSSIVSTVIGTRPSAPTTWSSNTSIMVGEDLYFFWVHNSEDGSSETYAQIDLFANGQKVVIPDIKNKDIDDEDHKDDVKKYKVNTNSYKEGTQLLWKVRTAGITNEYGEWSTQRKVDIWAPPTLELSIRNSKNSVINTITEFPFRIKGVPGPASQAPIGYYVSIISNQTYETTDRIGNKMIVSKGDEVFSRYYDYDDEILDISLTPDQVDLENNVTYTISVTVSMNSGLSATSSKDISVSWTDVEYIPSADISYDPQLYCVYIRPYCSYNPIINKVAVTLGEGSVDETKYGIRYDLTDRIAEVADPGYLLEDAYYEDGEKWWIKYQDDNGNWVNQEDNKRIYSIYRGKMSGGTPIDYYKTIGPDTLIDNIELSVYRREFDGTFTQIASGLSNTDHTFVTDPHPALDYARYRIIAMDTKTGAISFTDLPAFPIQEKAIIIQWDEEWSSFDIDDDGSELEQQPWSGSLLKLPYNIDVSNKNEIDSELVQYVGRRHPVAYYGTQVGETATWNTTIPMYDKETLYGLRRLSIWMGDVYVREPSGSGYWANIKVSFSQTHKETTIPVSLEISRVEGGV